MNHSTSKRYREILSRGQLQPDPHQQQAVVEFDRLASELSQPPANWFKRVRARQRPVKGIYLWGGVGRGKTWLMDLFYDALDVEAKRRVHFHRFMMWIHSEMQTIKGRKEPLAIIAKRMAKDLRLLCLDEFTVIDIGDAMILANLLKAITEEGITLVTTSNIPPHELYMTGIQRASFLPAITLLEQQTRVISIGGDRDYRRQLLESLSLYHSPLGGDAEGRLTREFEQLATKRGERDGELLINGRAMPFRRRAGGAVWFDFDALCGPPRSQHDYIEVSRCHHTVFISNIPQLDSDRDDRSRRFIFLVDEFYDRRVKVVISAEQLPEQLYSGERLAFEFQRTSSRLREMQSSTYLSQSHLG